jgi:hypothetical protein
VPDTDDAFPFDPAESHDTDGDGVGDVADAFPDDPDESADTDGDGIGDNGDPSPFDPNPPDDGGSDAEPPASPGLCGVGMLGTFVPILWGLSLMRGRCRRLCG